VVHLEGTRPWLWNKNPPRFRFRIDVVTRVIAAMMDLGGVGQWEYVSARTNRFHTDLLGEDVAIAFDVSELGIRDAFGLLPRDARAVEEFTRLRLTGTPYGGPELLVPHDSDTLAGAGRYLYLLSWGHLLVRDAEAGFTGWRWAGTAGGDWLLAASDEHLFGTSNVGLFEDPVTPPPGEWKLFARPATPAAAGWQPLGPMPAGFDGGPGVMFAAAGGQVFAGTARGTLWTRPATATPAGWRPAGQLPGRGGRLLGDRDRLYLLEDEGRLWERPADQIDAGWRILGAVGKYRTATIWAGRLVCWNPPANGGQVLSRLLRPTLGEWAAIGRVDPGESFLGYRW
jgi:hypothetical protein